MRSRLAAGLRRWSQRPDRGGLRGNLALTGAAWVLDLVVWNGDRELRDGGLVPPWLVPVVSAVVFATLLPRHRLPVVVFAVQFGYAVAAGWLIPGYGPFAGLLVALYAVARHRGATLSVPAVLACALPIGLGAYGTVRRSGGSVATGLAVLGVLSALPAVAAWTFGFRARHVDVRTARLEAERDAAADAAVHAERLRIARELHDIVAHSVSVMVLQAAGARAVLASDPVRTGEALAVVQEVGTQAMTELRRLLGLLRSAAGDDTGAAASDRPPGLADLAGLVDQMRSAGLAVDLAVDGTPVPIDPVLGLTVHRVTQEALTNTMKHAGTGASAQVRLVWGAERMTVTVTDRVPERTTPAATAPRLSTGHGLLGLRERIRLVDGVLDARPVPGGFRVHAALPLRHPSGRGAP